MSINNLCVVDLKLVKKTWYPHGSTVTVNEDI